MTQTYIHGTSAKEQQRLALMNTLINEGCAGELSLSDQRLVLDVGAGTGHFTQYIANRLPKDARVIAVERDERQLETARSTYFPDGKSAAIEFRQGEATALPLTETEIGAVDLAHARFVLEHVQKPIEVVRSMVATLRTNGRIIVADDDHDIMRFSPENPALMDVWRAYYKTYEVLGYDPCIGRKLVSLIHQAGAKPVRNTQVFYGACAGSPEFEGIVENIAGVLDSAKSIMLSEKLISRTGFETAIDTLRCLPSIPGAAVWYGINWAEGKKP